MHDATFIIISCIFAALGFGLLVSPKTSFIGFLMALCLFPSGNAYADINYRLGIYAPDFFFVGAALYLITRRNNKKNKHQKTIFNACLLTAGIYFVYATVRILKPESIQNIELKDFRPLILLLETYITASLCSSLNDKTRLSLNGLALLAAAGVIAQHGAILTGMYSTNDQFYSDNSFRYIGLGTYLSTALLLISLTTTQSVNKLNKMATLLCFVTLLLSNSRTLLFASIIALITLSVASPKQLAKAAIISATTITLFFLASTQIESTRVLESTDLSELQSQLAARYFPFIDKVSEMSTMNYLLGFGFGTTFDIPWFAYRDLDPMNISLDNAYFTHYAKFGVIGLLLLLSSAYAIAGRLGARANVSISIFLAITFWTAALFYEVHFLGFLVACVIASEKLSITTSPRKSKAHKTLGPETNSIKTHPINSGNSFEQFSSESKSTHY